MCLKAEFDYMNDDRNEDDVDPHPFRMAANGVRVNLFLKSNSDLDRLTTISTLPISPAGIVLARFGNIS